MSAFIWIAIAAYLLFAVNAVIDKFLLRESRIGHPATYAFAIGMLSILAAALMPFGFFVPGSYDIIALSLAAGALFTYALLSFFAALKGGEASRVVPIQGGLVPFFTLILAYFIAGERLGQSALIAFGFLVSGTLFLTMKFGAKSRSRVGPKVLFFAVLAAFLFAASFTLTKEVFDSIGFINGFVWTRFGMAGAALTLFINSGARHAIISARKKTGSGTGVLFLAGQAIGALAAVAQNYAISLGSVTIVNALQGTQFLFLFALTILFSVKYPRILREDLSKQASTLKFIGIILVSFGVAVLAIAN